MAGDPFIITDEQLDWCRRVSRQRTDYPLDRDDLFSFALEALWIAQEAGVNNPLAYAIAIFLKLRANLLRRAYVHRRVFNVLDLDACAYLFQDETCPSPNLVLMAKEQEGRQLEGPPCKLCGTRYGRGRLKNPRIPARIHGLCYRCDQRRRRLDRV